MASSWKLSSTYAMALVAKSPEASTSQWDPPTVTRRPQNGLSPRLAFSYTRPSKSLLPSFTLGLAPLCLLQPGSSIKGWRQRCSSDGLASDKTRTKPNLSLPTTVTVTLRCFSSQVGWWVSPGWAAWWPDLACDPYRPPAAWPSYLPPYEPHTSQHSRLRVE